MSRTNWVEVTCDGCGCAEQFLPPMSNRDLEIRGYIVRKGKHFCSNDCESLYDDAIKAKTAALTYLTQ